MRPSYLGIPENAAPGSHDRVLALLAGEPDVRRVLDAPSGAGAFCLRLIETGREAWAGDIEDSLAAPGPKLARLDLNERLPFENGFFDAIVSIDGIEHLERPFDFVREVARSLRPGGVTVISTPNVSALRSRWRFLWTGHHNKGKVPLDETAPTPLHHIGLLTFHELRYMLHSSGLRVEAIATNRTKLVSWLYAPLAPLAWLLTAFVYRREEKDPAQRERNREILRQSFHPAVLFGETLIVKARKVGAAVPTAVESAKSRARG